MRGFLAILLCWICLSSRCAEAQNSALETYKAANYAAAIPLLKSATAASPGDAILQAALLSSLVQEDRIDEASDLDEHDAVAFATSPEVTAARGELAFHLGDMGQAERLLKSAIKLKEDNARAVFGLSQLYQSASLYRTARLLCLRAHEIDPEDALITRRWLLYAAPAKRKELLGPFAAAHPWLFKHYEESQSTAAAVGAVADPKRLFEVEGGAQEATLHFVLLMRDAQHARGVGLEMRINNSRPLRLLFDTGASGILVKQSAIDRNGLQHLGSGQTWGLGDKGTRNTFAAVSETCQIATLKFKSCLIRALEGKKSVAGDEDGLIGADFFSDYLVDIDFEKRLLHLKPLPPREPDPQGYNRVISPDEAGFTPVFRFAHHLYVLTKVNNKCSGLFLLDTGSSMSAIDSTFARLSTKIHGNEYMQVHGISGSVGSVFEADKAELQFARFRQSNLGLTSFNLNNAPEPPTVRMAGILGIPVLAMFHLTIDYRNGLVNFDYKAR